MVPAEVVRFGGVGISSLDSPGGETALLFDVLFGEDSMLLHSQSGLSSFSALVQFTDEVELLAQWPRGLGVVNPELLKLALNNTSSGVCLLLWLHFSSMSSAMARAFRAASDRSLDEMLRLYCGRCTRVSMNSCYRTHVGGPAGVSSAT